MLNGRRMTGFTLIELMIVIVIMSILSAIAMPSFQVWLHNTQIRNAAESVVNGLQRARAEAVTRNTDIEFELSADSTWTVRVVGGDDIETRSSSEGSRNVTINIAPLGLDTVTFNGFGGIKSLNGDGSAPFHQVNVDSAVLSADESQNLRITIGIGGNVRMCDPNASAGTARAC